jgi:hypothetical protein
VQYAKAIAAAVAAVLAAVVPALYVPGPLGFAEWVNIVLLACGAIQVYNSANLPSWKYGKLVAAAVSAAGVSLASALSDGVTRAEWIQVAIAALGAFAVYQAPNAPTEVEPTQRGKHEAPDDDGVEPA